MIIRMSLVIIVALNFFIVLQALEVKKNLEPANVCMLNLRLAPIR